MLLEYGLTKKTQLDRLLTWHIGVIESIDAESITFFYLQSNSYKDRCCLVYSESATTLCTPKEQIIATWLSVEYSSAIIIRGKITKETVIEPNDLLSSYKEKQLYLRDFKWNHPYSHSLAVGNLLISNLLCQFFKRIL